MNQEQLKDKIKDFKQRFVVGGWLNENINVAFVEEWLVNNFLTKESTIKSPTKIVTTKVEIMKEGTVDDKQEVTKEVSITSDSKEVNDTSKAEQLFQKRK